jgi:hypothetical protein
MLNASRIKHHMYVRGSDGRHVGTVLGVENDRIVVDQEAWTIRSTSPLWMQ